MAAATTPFPLSTPQRQSVFYILFFAGTGASLPFMPVWLKAHGMSAGQIGVILAAPLLARAVSGPFSGLWADRFRLFRTPLVWLAGCGAVCYALMGLGGWFPGGRFFAYLVLFGLAFTLVTSVSPLIDGMTMTLARREGFAYAVPRAAGSASFILANVVVGLILLRAPADAILIWIVTAAAASALGAHFVLGGQPRFESTPPPSLARQSGWQRIGVLIRTPGLVGVLLACGCLQAAHSFYYAFSTLIWKAQGLSSAMCGYLWAIAVTGEVAYMAQGEALRRWIGPWRMLLLAGAFSIVRWSALMLAPPAWMLWPLQLLHLFSFAATYLAGLELVQRLAPRGYEGLAQTLNAAWGSGLMVGLATLSSGAIYEAMGVMGYGVSAVMALAGLAVAAWLYLNRARFLGLP